MQLARAQGNARRRLSAGSVRRPASCAKAAPQVPAAALGLLSMCPPPAEHSDFMTLEDHRRAGLLLGCPLVYPMRLSRSCEQGQAQRLVVRQQLAGGNWILRTLHSSKAATSCQIRNVISQRDRTAPPSRQASRPIPLLAGGSLVMIATR
jgi:hypothetical protein